MADSKEKLFSDFPAVSTEQWMEKITADLKGADFEKKLVWRTNEGFKVKPFYRQEDLEGLKTTEGLPGEFPYVRGTKKNDNTWFVRQEIKVECPKEANAKALDILNKGVDSLGFYVKKKDLSPEYIETLLNDICAECIELNFSTCQGHTVELAKLLVAYFQKKEYDLTKLQGSVNYDPMGKMMVKGKDLSNFITTAKELVEVLAPLPKFRCICVNAIELNNAGSYISQELGYALAWGNEYQQTGRSRSSCCTGCQENKIQFRHQFQLFSGNCQVPRSTYVMGGHRKRISSSMQLPTRMSEQSGRRHLFLCLQNGGTC